MKALSQLQDSQDRPVGVHGGPERRHLSSLRWTLRKIYFSLLMEPTMVDGRDGTRLTGPGMTRFSSCPFSPSLPLLSLQTLAVQKQGHCSPWHTVSGPRLQPPVKNGGGETDAQTGSPQRKSGILCPGRLQVLERTTLVFNAMPEMHGLDTDTGESTR